MARAYDVVDADGHIPEPLGLGDTRLEPLSSEAKHEGLAGGALGFYGLS